MLGYCCALFARRGDGRPKKHTFRTGASTLEKHGSSAVHREASPHESVQERITKHPRARDKASQHKITHRTLVAFGSKPGRAPIASWTATSLLRLKMPRHIALKTAEVRAELLLRHAAGVLFWFWMCASCHVFELTRRALLNLCVPSCANAMLTFVQVQRYCKVSVGCPMSCFVAFASTLLYARLPFLFKCLWTLKTERYLYWVVLDSFCLACFPFVLFLLGLSSCASCRFALVLLRLVPCSVCLHRCCLRVLSLSLSLLLRFALAF